MSDSVALRCSLCGLNWPLDNAYRECAQCGEPTSRSRNVTVMKSADAVSLKAHLDFERYYEKWDSDHPADRLLRDADGEPV